MCKLLSRCSNTYSQSLVPPSPELEKNTIRPSESKVEQTPKTEKADILEYTYSTIKEVDKVIQDMISSADTLSSVPSTPSLATPEGNWLQDFISDKLPLHIALAFLSSEIAEGYIKCGKSEERIVGTRKRYRPFTLYPQHAKRQCKVYQYDYTRVRTNDYNLLDLPYLHPRSYLASLHKYSF